MGNYLGQWSEPTPEERVIQNHHHDLQEAIIYPLNVASKLLQEGVVSRTLVSEVDTQGRSQFQNSTAIITAVTASIHSKPDQFQVFMSVLEDSPESTNLARRMRKELSTLKPASGPTERLLERKGWWYTVSAEYKEDFIDLQDSFGNVFDSLCSRSHVSVAALKEYLCQNFPELVLPLRDVFTIDNVIEIVRKNSSLTDLAYVKVISKHFDLQEMKQKIDDYCRKLDSFCQHTLDNHSYVRSFREDYPRYILTFDKIVFQLQWKANEKTLKDIRDVLQKSFGHLADRVQIVVIEDGSVVVVCWAPRYLMKELVRHASESVHKLAEMGVVKLTVGDTEVNIKEQSSSSSHWLIQEKKTAVPIQYSSEPFEHKSMPTHLSSAEASSSGSSRYERKQSKKITYLTRLSFPKGMVISQEGHLIVAEFSSITIINTDSGEVINRFGRIGSGQVEFSGPAGVSLTQDGYIIVAERCNHCLQVLTVEGAFVAAVGSKGSQPLQFNYPYDVAVHHNGNIFITELWNHRVQVLNPDLSYSHCFVSKGDKPGELNHPHGIAIDQDGMVYVSDQGHRQIKKFTPEGKVLAVFDNTRVSFSPYGLCIDSNNILYVADSSNNTVCVYNTSGQFLGYIGNSDGSSFDTPRFIISDKGRLYISDSNGVITYNCYQQ